MEAELDMAIAVGDPFERENCFLDDCAFLRAEFL